MRVAVLIPALDEAASLPGVLADLPDVWRCIVVDNGSTDGTARIAERCGAEVVREPQRGYGRAVRAGIDYLRPEPPEILVILDADHADAPNTLPALIEPIRQGDADLVQIDRSRTAEPRALTAVQRLGNGLATSLIRLVTGHAYADMGPFRAIRWEALEALDMGDPTWGWNVEMQMKAVHHGLIIVEIPLPYRRRLRGRSKISGTMTGAVRAGYRILLAVHRYRRIP